MKMKTDSATILEEEQVARAQVVVVISADAEWQAFRKSSFVAKSQSSPFGEWFHVMLTHGCEQWSVVFLHGGWGKIAAAGSTQYALDRWRPRLLVNLGTCGGIKGEVTLGTVLLVERTVVYDIIEQMGDAEAAIAHYTTTLDLSWLSEPYPQPVRRTLLVSADRDLVVAELAVLQVRYSAIAGDWESGAIAYVAQRNRCPCLILRGVTDLIGDTGDETYGNIDLYAAQAEAMMTKLIDALPLWLSSVQCLFRNT